MPINWTERKCGHVSTTHDPATAVRTALYKTRRGSQYRRASATERLNSSIVKEYAGAYVSSSTLQCKEDSSGDNHSGKYLQSIEVGRNVVWRKNHPPVADGARWRFVTRL